MEMDKAQKDRAARKLEAKKLKRQRIEAAGGKRPRPDKDKSSASSSNSIPPSKKSKKKTKSKSKSKNQPQQHRFGRVMEETPCPNLPRKSTLSLALPGSIVSNAQTRELRTHLVGQIARAAAIYHVDEIVVFDDCLGSEIRRNFYRGGSDRRRDRGRGGGDRDGDGYNHDEKKEFKRDVEGDGEHNAEKKLQASTDPHAFMARILQYCECPQYLRRHFFPMHPDLQFAGLLAPLDAPHHVRVLDRSPFREGVVLDKKKDGAGGSGMSLVNCGVRNQPVEIDRVLAPGIRCTVQIDPKAYTTPGKSLKGTVVAPSAPREHDGTYWGYTVRMAKSLKEVFDGCPWGKEGYDLKIGTSERGDVMVDDGTFENAVLDRVCRQKRENGDEPSFKHSIIVLGGVAGIEECVDADETLNISGKDSKRLFDFWVNVCPFQGSRTIRTEEAVLISLARLRPFLFSNRVQQGKADADTEISVSKHGNSNPVNRGVVEFSDEEPSDESSSDEDEE